MVSFLQVGVVLQQEVELSLVQEEPLFFFRIPQVPAQMRLHSTWGADKFLHLMVKDELCITIPVEQGIAFG